MDRPLAAAGKRCRRPIVHRLPAWSELLESRRLMDGLTGQYFNQIDHTEPAVTRTDATIDFTWSSAPAAGVKADFFSARWTGQVEAQFSEVYTFHTAADDGVRLWIDGRLLVDNWMNQGVTSRSGSVALEAGKRYDVRLDYYEFNLSARINLAWSSASTPKATIPAAQLFAAPAGLAATYFEDTGFGIARASRIEPVVNFNWPTGEPAGITAGDGFSARYSGYIVPEFSETYTFNIASASPETVRLRIDGKTIIDSNSVADDGRITLEAGKRYSITLDYADAAGSANVRLDWSSPSRPLQMVQSNRLFAGAATSTPLSRATYSNPTLNIDAPDPGFIRADGAFWMVHTMGGPDIGWPLWRSVDGVNWTFQKHLLTTGNKQPWMRSEFWAPEIHKVGNRFILTGTSTDARTNRLTIVMASSDRIDGNYTVRSEPIVSTNVSVLDSNIFRDDDGTLYLLWKQDHPSTGAFHGTIRIRQLDSTGMNFAAGSSERVILDNEFGGWENFLAEAPWLVRRADAYYLFYSGSPFDTSYAVGVARSTTLTGLFERNPANPIIRNNDTWIRPGHGAFAQDADGTMWHLYHAYRASDPGAGRKQVLDKVVWTSTYPTFENASVSTTPRAGPLVEATTGAGVITLPGTSANDAIRVARSVADSSILEIYNNGTLVRSVVANQVQQLVLDTGSGEDTLELDFTRGNVVLGSGISFLAGAGNIDTVRITDPNGLAASRFLGVGQIAFGSGLLSMSGVERFIIGGGTHRVVANLGTGTSPLPSILVAAGIVNFEADQRLASLSIASGAKSALANGGRTLVTNVLQLGPTASLDVNDGAIVIDYAAGAVSPMAGIVTALRTGRASGNWDGTSGVVSSAVAAAGSSAGLTLGVAEASTLSSSLLPTITLDASAVVIRQTISGDANLDRSVNFGDLVRLAQSYNTSGKTFGDGDFDYDGTVNFADLVLLAQRYNTTYVPAAPVRAASVSTRARR